MPTISPFLLGGSGRKPLACALLVGLLFLPRLGAAEQVQPSAEKALAPGQSISEYYYQNRFRQPYVLQRLTERTYWVAVDRFATTFHVGKQGVMVIDSLQGGRGQQVLNAIASVTDLPLAVLVYSHSHLDHIGDAPLLVEAMRKAGVKPRIIANDLAVQQLQRFPGQVPEPTEVVATPYGEFEFEGMKVQVHTPAAYTHSPDNSLYYLPSERLVHFPDAVIPGNLPFMFFNTGLDVSSLLEGIDLMLGLDWDFYNGGYGYIGSRQDVQVHRDYTQDVIDATLRLVADLDFTPRADAHPVTNMVSAADLLAAQVKAALAPKYDKYQEFDTVIRSHVIWVVRQSEVHGF